MILFEKFSFVKFIVLLFKIRKEGGFYIFNDCARSSKPPDLKSIEKLCRKVVPGIRIKTVGHYEYPREFFLSSYNLPFFIHNKVDSLHKTPICKMLISIYNDTEVITGLKKIMLHSIKSEFYFYHFAKKLAENNEEVVVIPYTRDSFGLLSEGNNLVIPVLVVFINKIKDLYLSIKTFFVYLAFLLHNIHKIRKAKPAIPFKYASHMSFDTLNDERESLINNKKIAIRTRWDSFFLEDGKEFLHENILYCFDIWRFSQEREARIVDYIKNRGGRYCYVNDLASSLLHFLGIQVKQYGIKGLVPMLASVSRGGTNLRLAEYAVKFFYNTNKWEIFCLHFRPAVMMTFDDYSFSHIARTLVFRKYGLKNAGIHHPAETGLYTGDIIAFVYYDMYFQYGTFMEKCFRPFWDDVPRKIVGLLRSDLIYQSINDEKRRTEFKRKYGSKKTVLVNPPGSNLVNLPSKVDEFYNAIARLVLSRNDLAVIIRPRGFGSSFNAAYSKVMSSAFETGQIFIELEEFDMHELIAYSDLVVSIYSSVIQEAIDAGKTALAFCTKGLDELYPLYELAPDLVADNGKQLFDRINDCLDNHVTLDNMVSLRKELGCGCDGKVVQRIREGLVSLAEDNCHN